MVWFLFIIIIVQSVTIWWLIFKPKKRLPPIFKIDVHIDKDFKTSERVSILDSLWQWEDRTHGIVKFNVINMHAKYMLTHTSGENSLNFVRATSEDPIVKYWNEGYDKNLLGLAATLSETRLIFLLSNKIENEKEHTKLVLHEIGHILGLNHSKTPGTIMYPYANNMAEELTEQDVQQFLFTIRNSLADFKGYEQ